VSVEIRAQTTWTRAIIIVPQFIAFKRALTLSEFSWPSVWTQGLPSGSTDERQECNFWNKCPCPFSRNLCWTFSGPHRTNYSGAPTVGRLQSPNYATWNIEGREGRPISFAELWSYCVQKHKSDVLYYVRKVHQCNIVVIKSYYVLTCQNKNYRFWRTILITKDRLSGMLSLIF